MRIVVTGGSGFVGSHLIKHLMSETNADIVNVDTYVKSPLLSAYENCARYYEEERNVAEKDQVAAVYARYRPNAVFHLAGEHDMVRTVRNPRLAMQTNIYGTFCMLEGAVSHVAANPGGKFVFVQVSGGDVYGDAHGCVTERSRYKPMTPLAASKAAGDHLACSWHHTYGVKAVVVHGSSVYGPWQEWGRLIPSLTVQGLKSGQMSVDGKLARDWLHVSDFVRAICAAATHGSGGEVYNFGGNETWTDEQVVNQVCDALDAVCPRNGGHKVLIRLEEAKAPRSKFSMNTNKSYNELNWVPKVKFMQGIRETVEWIVCRHFELAGIRCYPRQAS